MNSRLAEEDALAAADRSAARDRVEAAQRRRTHDEFTRLASGSPGPRAWDGHAPKALGNGDNGAAASALALRADFTLNDAVTEALRLRRRVRDDAAQRCDEIANRHGTLSTEWERASAAATKARDEYERFLEIVCEHRRRVLLEREPSLTRECLRCGSEILWAFNRDFCGPECAQGYQPFEGVWFHRCRACHRHFYAGKDGGLGGIPKLVDDVTFCSFTCVLLSDEDVDDWPSEHSACWANVVRYVPPPPMTSAARLAHHRRALLQAYKLASDGQRGLPATVAYTPTFRGLISFGGRTPVPRPDGAGSRKAAKGQDSPFLLVSFSRQLRGAKPPSARERLLAALSSDGKTVAELAAAAGVSLGYAHSVLTATPWVARSGAGSKTDPFRYNKKNEVSKEADRDDGADV
jgi:hypothetical protein